MQIQLSQVIVQVAPARPGAAGMPVFNISRAPLESLQGGSVKISALARALAGVAPTGAGPQLSLAVSYVGSFGTPLSFTPFAPAAAAAEFYARLAREGEPQLSAQAAAPGGEETAAQGDDAVVQANVAPATTAVTAPAPADAVTAYRVVAQANAGSSAGVDVSA